MTTSEIIGAKVTVTDLPRSIEFYESVLGLVEVRSRIVPRPDLDLDAPATQIIMNFSGAVADTHLCLVRIRDVTIESENARRTTVILRVDDVDPVLERARTAGVPLERELVEAYGMRFAFLRDPDGHTIEIYDATEWPPVE